MDMTTSMPPEQAEAQRQRAWLRDERIAVLNAARDVIQRVSTEASSATPDARALRQSGTEVRELLADLIDAQREAERHDSYGFDGDVMLAAYVTALRAPRDAAKAAALQLDKGAAGRSLHVGRANAYTWAIKALIPTAEVYIAVVRREVAEAQEWLRS